MNVDYCVLPMLKEMLGRFDDYDELRRAGIVNWLEDIMDVPSLGLAVRQYFLDGHLPGGMIREHQVLSRFHNWLEGCEIDAVTTFRKDNIYHLKAESNKGWHEERLIYGKAMPMLDLEQALIIREDRQIPLTPVENSIITLLYHARGRVVTHRRFEEWAQMECNALGCYEPKHHIRHLREKLGDNLRNPVLISSRRGIGYSLNPLVGCVGSY